MQSIRSVLSSILRTTLVVGSLLLPSLLAAADPLMIQPGETSHLFSWRALGEAGSPVGVLLVSDPLHGTVTVEAGGLRYAPTDDLWRTGVDVLRYRTTPGPSPIRTVLVHAATYPVERYTDFESGNLAGWQTGGSTQHLAVAPTAALDGGLGLWVEDAFENAGGGAYLSYGDANAPGVSDPGGIWGGGQQGSGGGSGFIPPTSSGSGGGGIVPGDFAIYEVQTDGGWVRVWLAPVGNRWALTAGSDTGDATSRILHAPSHRFDLFVRDAYSPSASTAQLFLDGDLVGEIDVTAGQAVKHTHRIGGLHFNDSTRPRLALDDVVVYEGDAQPSVAVEALDGFESGSVDLSRWTSFGTPQVISGQGLVGDYCLRFNLSPGSSGGFLSQALTTPADRFGARWRFGIMKGGQFGSGLSLPFDVELFRISDAAGSEVAGAKLRWDGVTSDAELRLWAREAGGSLVEAAPVLVPAQRAGQAVTVDWRRASGDQVANGRVRMWVDETLAVDLDGLDNHHLEAAGYRFGALTLNGSPDFVLDIDELEAWTGTH